jgi:hypothetical protein
MSLVLVLVALALTLAAGAGWTARRRWVIPAVRRHRRRAAARRQLGWSLRVAAPRSGAAVPRRTARPAAGGDPAPPDPTRQWLAEVRWDETGARFRVVASSLEDGSENVIAASEPVEWPPASPAAFRRMADAAQGLSDALERAGWAPMARGKAWYAARFMWLPDDGRSVGPEHAALWAGPEPEASAPEPPGPRARTDRFQRDARPAETDALWRCEIRWRSGQTRSHFEAVARDLAGGSRPVAGSENLGRSTRAAPGPEDDRARAAVGALRDALLDDGWTPIEPGSPWYAERFVWRRDGTPPTHLDAATPSTAGRT